MTTFVAARRHRLRMLLARGSDQLQSGATLAQIVVTGARTMQLDSLFEKLVRDEARWEDATRALTEIRQHSAASDDVTAELALHARWATSIRACRADWLLSEFSQLLAREPPPIDGTPLDTIGRIMHALRPDAAPAEFATATLQHPAAMLWASRLVVQQALPRGNLETALPIVARFAEATRLPSVYFEAAILYAATGRIADSLNYVDAIGTAEPFATLAKPLSAVLQLLSGQNAEALAQLEACSDTDRALEYARGVALRALARPEDALIVFEKILDEAPKHAPALEQATRCCDDLAAHTHRVAQAHWTRRANRYAKAAAQLGRDIAPTRRGRQT